MKGHHIGSMQHVAAFQHGSVALSLLGSLRTGVLSFKCSKLISTASFCEILVPCLTPPGTIPRTITARGLRASRGAWPPGHEDDDAAPRPLHRHRGASIIVGPSLETSGAAPAAGVRA